MKPPKHRNFLIAATKPCLSLRQFSYHVNNNKQLARQVHILCPLAQGQTIVHPEQLIGSSCYKTLRNKVSIWFIILEKSLLI